MNIRPLVGLLGVLLAAMSADLNEYVSLTTLTDVRGALGVSYDPGLWIASLYITGVSVGMAFAPWNAVTFTLAVARWPSFRQAGRSGRPELVLDYPAPTC